jgi:uncharacterized protein
MDISEFSPRNRFIYQLFSDSHPLVKLFMVFFVILTSLLLFSFISILLAIPFFNISLNEIEVLFKGNLNNIPIPLLKYIQITQSIALFIIPSLFLSYLFFNKKDEKLPGREFPSLTVIVLVLVIMFFSLPLIDKLVQWNEAFKFPPGIKDMEQKFIQMEDDAAKLTIKLLSGNRSIDFIVNLLMIAIIPAIGEEFLFRGILQKIFYQWTRNPHLAIIICAILFSSIHMQFFGFVPRMLLGALFGYFFFWSNNIWIAVAAHFFNNAFAVFSNFSEVNNKFFIVGFLKNEQSNNVIQIIICIIIVTTGIFLVRKISSVKAGVTEV